MSGSCTASDSITDVGGHASELCVQGILVQVLKQEAVAMLDDAPAAQIVQTRKYSC